MAIVQKIDYLNRGTKLIRHYDSDFDLVQQVDGLSYYQALEDQLAYDFGGYYSNKFFQKVTLNIHSTFSPMQYNYPAYCWDKGNGRSEIHARYYETRNGGDGAYKLPANISHEFGHAYHNWAQCFYQDEYKKFFSKLITKNAVEYNENTYPWNQGENPWEQFANAYRIIAGTLNTRGVSGPPHEGIAEGFKDPKDIPDLKKMLQLLPEVCGYWRKYGLKDSSLSWQGHYYQFLDNSNSWIAQTDYYTYYKWNGYSWQRIYPIYDVY